MKWKIAIALLLGLLALLIGNTAEAQCPDSDLFCPPWWTIKEEMQKQRIALMEAGIKDPYYEQFIANCDTSCTQKYNESSLGVLYAFADKNHLPRNLTVLYALVINDQWGRQNQASFNGNKEHDLIVWQKHFFWGWIDLASKLNLNPPLQMMGDDEMVWCVKEEYGGHCPGKW